MILGIILYYCSYRSESIIVVSDTLDPELPRCESFIVISDTLDTELPRCESFIVVSDTLDPELPVFLAEIADHPEEPDRLQPAEDDFESACKGVISRCVFLLLGVQATITGKLCASSTIG